MREPQAITPVLRGSHAKKSNGLPNFGVRITFAPAGFDPGFAQAFLFCPLDLGVIVAQSLPRRGAWIATLSAGDTGAPRRESLPRRGAWIATSTSERTTHYRGGRSLAGGRGLQPAIDTGADARARGAWIATLAGRERADQSMVAPSQGGVDCNKI